MSKTVRVETGGNDPYDIFIDNDFTELQKSKNKKIIIIAISAILGLALIMAIIYKVRKAKKAA